MMYASKSGKRVSEEESLQVLQDFSVVLIKRYGNYKKAFKAFDYNGNGSLSGAEFTTAAKQLGFPGDLTTVFKAMDGDRLGDISVSEFQILQELYDEFPRE